MAEALYPKEPPPSYESQFHFLGGTRRRIEVSPVPSAPPPSHNPRSHVSSSSSPNRASPQIPRRTYNKVAIQKHETIPEKVDLSETMSSHVPKRAPPPPPPPSICRNSTHLQNPQRSRPFSSTQLDSGYYGPHSGLIGERRDHSKAISASLRNVMDSDAGYNDEHNPYQSLHASGFQQPNIYESLTPRSSQGMYQQYPRQSSLNEEPLRPQIAFRRQSSAPSGMRRHHRLSLPYDSYVDPMSDAPQPSAPDFMSEPMHSSQHLTQPSLQENPQSVVTQSSILQTSPGGTHANIIQTPFPQMQPAPDAQPAVPQVLHGTQANVPQVPLAPHTNITQTGTPQAQVTPGSVQISPYLQQSQPMQTANPVHVQSHIQQPTPEQTSMLTQSQALEVAAKPQPKLRKSLSMPVGQAAMLSTNQPFPFSAQIQPANPLPQQPNTQQVTTNQVVSTQFQGQTQLQTTYSYAQQSSLVASMVQQGPGLPDTQSPAIISIPPTFLPTQMSFPFLTPPQPQTTQQGNFVVNSTQHTAPSQPAQHSPGSNTNDATTEVVSQEIPTSLPENSPHTNPVAGIRRPVPKPRKAKKQTQVDEVVVNDSNLETLGSDVQQVNDCPADTQDTQRQSTDDSSHENTEANHDVSDAEGEEEIRDPLSVQTHDQPQDTEQAPAKPPRLHVRKPAPPPPTSRPSDDSVVVQHSNHSMANNGEPATPSGYNLRDIFFNGNIIFLLPLSDPLRLPVKVSGNRLNGQGNFKNDCKFEVVFLSSAIGHEQTVLVIMLKCFSRINRYLAVSKRGKVKIVKGASEKCKFVVRQVTDRPLLRYGVITLESAIHPEWTIAVTSNGRTRNCKQAAAAPVKPDEARLMVRAERIFNQHSSTLMNFERISVVNQLRDRRVIQLQSKDSLRFLCLTTQGKLRDTGNKGDITTHFVILDRGMGVVSLRSNKTSRLWLRVKQSRIQGNERPDLAVDFRVKESPDGTVQFESIIAPGIYLTPPCGEGEDVSVSRDFIIKTITK